MPRYYCDYCDTYLTHDSPSVRKTHCAGRKHLENVKIYYEEWAAERTQSAINAIIAAQKAGQMAPPAPANTWPFPPPPNMGFRPPTPNMYPYPMGFCPPNGMPQGPNFGPQRPYMVPQTPYMVPQTPNMGPQIPHAGMGPQISHVGLQGPNVGPQMPHMMYSGLPTRYPMPQMPLVNPPVTYGHAALPGHRPGPENNTLGKI